METMSVEENLSLLRVEASSLVVDSGAGTCCDDRLQALSGDRGLGTFIEQYQAQGAVGIRYRGEFAVSPSDRGALQASEPPDLMLVNHVRVKNSLPRSRREPGNYFYQQPENRLQSDSKDSSSNSPKSCSSSEFDPPPLQFPGALETSQEQVAFHHDDQWVRRTGRHHVHLPKGNCQATMRHGMYTEESGEDSDSSNESEWPYGALRQSLDQLMGSVDQVPGLSSSSNVTHMKKRQEHLRAGPALGFTQLQVAAQTQHHRRTSSDPRAWDLDAVQSWLKHESRKHNIAVELDRFHMNGKGLVLMGLQGFQRRMPQAGHLLHRDLRRMLRAQQLVQRR